MEGGDEVHGGGEGTAVAEAEQEDGLRIGAGREEKRGDEGRRGMEGEKSGGKKKEEQLKGLRGEEGGV